MGSKVGSRDGPLQPSTTCVSFNSILSLSVLICEMGRPWCLPLWAAGRIKEEGVDRARGTDSIIVAPAPISASCPGCCPSQSWSPGFWEGDSASLLAQLAWPLTFRAPRLSRPPDCLLGGWGECQPAPRLTPPAPAPTLSLCACELINLSPFVPKAPRPLTCFQNASRMQDESQSPSHRNAECITIRRWKLKSARTENPWEL